MEEHSDIFSKLIKRKKPVVPENYFEQFSDQLSKKIDFNQDRKTAVPEGFFQNFQNDLMDEIESLSALKSLGVKKRKSPEVPDGFFNGFAESISHKINERPKKGNILKITFWSTAAAVAAGLVLLFTLNTNEPETIISSEVNEDLNAEEEFETYAAYVDEESIIDYIVENDVDLGEEQTDDDTYDYVNSDIEDIYLDLD
jgi:hypothetical protein